MRKLILMLFLSVSCLMQAQVMDEATALAKAKAFVQERGTATATISARRAKSTSTAPATRINKTSSQVKRVKSPSPYLYAFNVGSNDGFVIMTADNSASVIGYADEGSLDPNNMPEALKYYLQCYGAQVKQAIDEGTTVDLISARSSATNGARRAAVTVKDPIAPLCSCHWAQTMPFNYTCGYSGSDRYLVGCVPLAMAQIMYYFKYPASYADWSNMQDYYPASSNYDDIAASNQSPTNASEKAVAELLAKCGKALNVSYGTSVTTGYSSQIPSVLKGLGYSSSCQNVNKSSYSEGAFINLIYNELSNKRPVVLGGYTYSSSGHAWVCDGYSSDNYFHMNWGFNNGSDGYYTLANVAPSAQGAGGADTNNGYSSNMNAVIGITYSGAETGESYTGTAASTTSNTTNLTCSNASCTSAEFIVTITNKGTEDFTGTLTAKLGSTNGSTLGADGFYIGAGETVTISVAIDGSELTTSNTVYLCSGNTSLAKARPATGGITGTAVKLTIIDPIEVGVGETKGVSWLDDECTVKVKVKNTTSSTVSGYIMGDLWTWATGYTSYTQSQGIYEYAVIPANGEYIATMTLTGLKSATDVASYQLDCYTYDNTSLTYSADDSTSTISIYPRFGYGYWTADGTYKGSKVTTSGTAIETPETAVAMLITTSNISSVTPNSNPNTLYYIDNGVTVPSGLTGCNLIYSDGTNWSSTSTTFIETSEADMKGVYIPKRFTAANVNYKRTFTKGRGKTSSMGSGWGTIALPYSPTSIECEGEDLSFFKSASDTNGRFWLYRYNQVDGTQITWGYASEFKKNMPYLIAVPNDEWSTSLLNKTIEFKASNVVMAGSPTMIASTDTYNLKFVGTQEGASVTNAYTMNADGSNFVYNASATEVKPFHAYYTTNSSTVNATSNGTMTETFVATINEITASSTKVSTPTLAEATNITSTAFTTTWEACDNATSYELTLTGNKEVAKDTTVQVVDKVVAPITPLLTENFTGFNNGGSSYGTSTVTSSLDNYTQTSGWSGSYVYTAPADQCRVGSTSRTGANLTTPTITKPSDGKITIALWASQYDPTANNNNGANDGTTITVKAGSTTVGTCTPAAFVADGKSNATCYLFNTTLTSNSTISFTNTDKNRSILYYIGVYPGTYTTTTALEQALAGSTTYKDSTYTVMVPAESISNTYTTTGTSYTFTGLDNSYTYYCTARATDGTKYSSWSNIIQVILGQNALGDVDLDGDIDLDDLEALKAVLLESSTKAHGDTDINGSGETNIGDIPALIQMLKTNK